MGEKITKKGYYILGGMIGLYIVIVALFLSIGWTDMYDFTIRFFALTGLYMLSIAVLSTPFKIEIYQELGRSFQDIHHLFGAIGLATGTLHPVIFAIEQSDIMVFVPDVSSLYDFMLLGGRQALMILYVALVAVFVRAKIPKYWRSIHALMYIVLFFALVHGYLIGTDFENIGITMIFTALFIASLGALVYKRM